MTGDTFIKGQLALVCWRTAPETARNALNVLKAIGLIQRNRARAGWMGGDWLQVLRQDPMYSAYSAVVAGKTRLPDGLEEWPDLRNDIFQRFLWEVDKIYSGEAADDLTEGGLYWGETHRIDRPWFLEKIVRGQVAVAQVGQISIWR